MNDAPDRSVPIFAGSKLMCRLDNQWTTALPVESLPISPARVRRNRRCGYASSFTRNIEVLTLAPDLTMRWTPATALTISEAPTVILRMKRRKRDAVIVARDGAIAVFDPECGIARIPANDAVGRIVPFVRRLPESVFPVADDAYIGWLIGAFISDGWITRNHLGFTKVDPAIRAHMLKCWSRWRAARAMFKQYSSKHLITGNAIAGESTKVHISISGPAGHERALWLSGHCYHESAVTRRKGERTCLFKRLPPGFLDFGRKMRLSLLAGLIDGDGSVSLNRSRGKPQVLINFSTSSPYLAEDIRILLRSLGIQSGVSVTRPQSGRLQTHDSYTISISTPDVHAVMAEVPIVTQYEAWEHLREHPPANNDRDVVPIWPDVARHIREHIKWTAESAQKRTLASLAGPSAGCPLIARTSAVWYASHVPLKYDTPAMKLFRAIVANRAIGWDNIVQVTPAGSKAVHCVSLASGGPIALSSGLIV